MLNPGIRRRRKIVPADPASGCLASLLGSPVSSADCKEITLLDLGLILVRRKWAILVVTLAIVLVAIIASLLQKREYDAVVIFFPPKQNLSMATVATQLGLPESYDRADRADLGSDVFGFKDPNAVYVAMLRTQLIEDSIIKKFEMMRRYHAENLVAARIALEQHVAIDGESLSGTIRIDVRNRDPKEAANIANQYVDDLRKLLRHLDVAGAQKREAFLRKQVVLAKAKVLQAEQALEQEQKRSGVVQLDTQIRNLIKLGGELNARIIATQLEIQALQSYAANNNPDLVNANQQLQSLRAQLSQLSSSRKKDNGVLIAQVRVPQASLAYEQRLRDVIFYQSLEEKLAHQAELAKLDGGDNGVLIHVVDPALPPDHPSSPEYWNILFGAVVIGLLAGISYAFVSAGLERLKTAEGSAHKMAQLRGLWLRPFMRR